MCAGTGANSGALPPGVTPNPRPMSGNSGAWGNGSGPSMGPGSPGWNNANNNNWFNGGGWQNAYAQAGIGQGGGPFMQAQRAKQAMRGTDAGAPPQVNYQPPVYTPPAPGTGPNMPAQAAPAPMATIDQGGSMGYGAPQPAPAFAPGVNGGLLGTGGIKPDRNYQPTPGPWTPQQYTNRRY